MATARILLVGCGNMGRALLAGWLDAGVAADDVAVVDPDAQAIAEARARYAVRAVCAVEPLADIRPEAIVIAVKPQVLANVAPRYARFATTDCVFLTIVAGRTIAGLQARLGDRAALVRAMPNTPASVGRAISVACANARVSAEQRTLCQGLLSAVGTVEWVEDEALLDAVTAVSGSGPAYVFLLAECLAAAGVAAGLPPDLAERLARQTVAGAGELLHRSGEPAESLRRKVTSPGGTTAAALAVLMDGVDGARGLAPLLTAAVRAAAARSRALAG
jgi:pyrroline-5-carboxylate reductase